MIPAKARPVVGRNLPNWTFANLGKQLPKALKLVYDRGLRMDYVPLVEDQIEDGRRLIARLVAEGFKVTAASWIWDTEDGQ
jgi:hypothetical protein